VSKKQKEKSDRKKKAYIWTFQSRPNTFFFFFGVTMKYFFKRLGSE
jgi:hypothetical protein